MAWFKPQSLLDTIFEGGVLLKGLTGLMEFLGGVLLLFVTPEVMHRFIAAITQKELLEDPHDVLANALLSVTHTFGATNREFLIIYLWIHAGIKLIAVIGLLRNQLWAFPFSLITLGALMSYQAYLISRHPTFGLIVLTVFDVFVLVLIWREYKKVKAAQVA